MLKIKVVRSELASAKSSWAWCTNPMLPAGLRCPPRTERDRWCRRRWTFSRLKKKVMMLGEKASATAARR